MTAKRLHPLMLSRQDMKAFLRSDCAAMSMIAGILLVIIGGTMAIVGGFVGDAVHEAIRYDAIEKEFLGNMTGNTTTFTATWEPIDSSSTPVQTVQLWNVTNCAGNACKTATATQITTTPCGAAPCYNVSSYSAGTLHVDMTGSVAATPTNYVILASYAGVRSGTDMSNVYNKFMKALLIAGVALIATGAGVIFTTLRGEIS